MKINIEPNEVSSFIFELERMAEQKSQLFFEKEKLNEQNKKLSEEVFRLKGQARFDPETHSQFVLDLIMAVKQDNRVAILKGIRSILGITLNEARQLCDKAFGTL